MHTPILACQRAVRSNTSLLPPALWITDEVLATAYFRFVRVCQTTKRFTNNVPGPLEAQRRLAKRRLGGLSAVGASSSADIGVIFGNGPPVRHDLRWEAPSRIPEDFPVFGKQIPPGLDRIG